MNAVDTNVLVRYLTVDDAVQAGRARALIDGGPVWLSTTVLLETEWVLRSSYKLRPAAIMAALRVLAGQETVTVEEPGRVARAMSLCEAGMDFADALHLAATPADAGFRSFDAALVKQAKRLGLKQVEEA